MGMYQEVCFKDGKGMYQEVCIKGGMSIYQEVCIKGCKSMKQGVCLKVVWVFIKRCVLKVARAWNKGCVSSPFSLQSCLLQDGSAVQTQHHKKGCTQINCHSFWATCQHLGLLFRLLCHKWSVRLIWASGRSAMGGVYGSFEYLNACVLPILYCCQVIQGSLCVSVDAYSFPFAQSPLSWTLVQNIIGKHTHVHTHKQTYVHTPHQPAQTLPTLFIMTLALFFTHPNPRKTHHPANPIHALFLAIPFYTLFLATSVLTTPLPLSCF